MFTPIFSLAFVLIWGAISAIVIGTIWWGTGQYPGVTYRAVVGALAAVAAHAIEADLARRHARRRRLPRTHRKTPTGGTA